MQPTGNEALLQWPSLNVSTLNFEKPCVSLSEKEVNIEDGDWSYDELLRFAV